MLIVTGLRGGYVVPYDSPFTSSVAATVFFYSLTFNRVIKLPNTIIYLPIIAVGYCLLVFSLILLSLTILVVAILIFFKLRVPRILIVFLLSLTLYYTAAGLVNVLAIYGLRPQASESDRLLLTVVLSIGMFSAVLHPAVLILASSLLPQAFNQQKIDEIVNGVKTLFNLLQNSSEGLTNQITGPLAKKLKNLGRLRTEDGCLICCTKKIDTVILPCRHSGLCKECALVLLNTTDQCVQCKSQVSSVCVVDKSSGKTVVIEEIKLS